MSAISRPTAITVIGWLYVAGGILVVLSGAMGAAMSILLPSESHSSPSSPSGLQAPFQIVAYTSQHMLVVAAVLLMVGALILFCGLAMLRLRPWSRLAGEAISWLSLTYVVSFGAFWVWSVASSGLFNGPEPFHAFAFVFLCFGAVVCLAFTVPPIVIIRALRGPVVRQAFTGQRA